MTRNEILSAITSRCGEGYENWTERAKAHLKTAIIELVKSGQFTMNDYPLLLLEGEYENETDATITELNFTNLLPAGTELLRIVSTIHKVRDGEEYTDKAMNLVSHNEYQAYEFNTNLLPSTHDICYLIYNGTIVYLKNLSLAIDDKVEYIFLIWNDDYISTADSDGDINTESHFSAIFLEFVIARASELLMQEIKA